MTITIEFDIVTPAIAKKIAAEQNLENSISVLHHRPQKAINLYANDMLADRWPINGDAIIFDWNGKMIDGRKRILAAARHDASFPTMIVRGVDPAAHMFIDQHKRRQLKDVLHSAGYDDAGNFSAAITSIADIAIRGLPSQSVLSHGSLLRMARDFPDIQNVRAEAAVHFLRKYYSPSDLAALIYLTRMISVAESNRFFLNLKNAFENRIVGSKDPFQSLAASLAVLSNAVGQGAQSGGSKTRYHQIVYTIKTWNAVRSGVRSIHLRYDSDKEAAPLMQGLPPNIFAEYMPSEDLTSKPSQVVGKLEKKGLPKGRVETITPEIAETMLLSNGPLHDGMGRNRQRSHQDVDAYARDISAKRWLVTGQSIKISKSGRLLDGQHRLYAVIESGEPINIVVVRDLDEDIFSTFDVAHQHTFSNYLTAIGEPSASTVEGALKLIWRHRELGLFATGARPTISELMDLFEECQGIRDHVRSAATTGFRKQRLSPSYLAALMLIFHGINSEKATTFFNSFETGVMLADKSPVHELRDALVQVNNWATRNERVTVNATPKIKLICHAWNAYLAGRSRIKLPKKYSVIVALEVPPPYDKPAATTIKKPAPIVDGDDWAVTPAA